VVASANAIVTLDVIIKVVEVVPLTYAAAVVPCKLAVVAFAGVKITAAGAEEYAVLNVIVAITAFICSEAPAVFTVNTPPMSLPVMLAVGEAPAPVPGDIVNNGLEPPTRWLTIRSLERVRDEAVAFPIFGVTRVGLVSKTRFPEPVLVDITLANSVDVVEAKSLNLLEVVVSVPEVGSVKLVEALVLNEIE